MKKLLICMLALALALLAGCAPASVQEPEDGKLHIVATVFPAYDFARAAAGDLADVELLLPPGTESHSYEPTPADILKVQSCDLFLYLGGDSDQWVETILEAAEPTGRTLALIDCVETLEEEHVEGIGIDIHILGRQPAGDSFADIEILLAALLLDLWGTIIGQQVQPCLIVSLLLQ